MNNHSSWYNSKIFIYAAIVLAVTLVLVIISEDTSPLYPINVLRLGTWDQALFRLMGRTQLHGVPYLDFFDHKGPVLFAILGLAELLGGRTVIFIFQVLAWSIGSVFVYKSLIIKELLPYPIFGQYQDYKKSNLSRLLWPLAGVVILLLLICKTKFYAHGNQVEEWMVPLLCWPFYLLLKSLQKPLNWWQLTSIGICAALVAGIRLNDAVPVFGTIMVVWFYQAARSGLWSTLFRQYICGLVGLAIVWIPIVLWYYYHDALYLMWYGSITYNFYYATQNSMNVNSPFLSFARIVYLGLPLMICIVACLISFWRIDRQNDAESSRTGKIAIQMWIILTLIFAFGFAVIGQRMYSHYLISYLPFMAIFIVHLLRSIRLQSKLLRGALALIVSLILLFPLKERLQMDYQYILDHRSAQVAKAYRQLTDAFSTIPPSERNQIWTTNWSDLPLQFFIVNDVLPLNRCFLLTFSRPLPADFPYRECRDKLECKKPLWILDVQTVKDQHALRPDTTFIQTNYSPMICDTLDYDRLPGRRILTLWRRNSYVLT